jgi:hypothetical protein
VAPADFFAPLHPAVLAAFALASPDIRAVFACLNDARARRGSCDVAPLRPIVVSQAVLAAVTTTLIFAAALEVFAAAVPALATLLIVLATGTFASYAMVMLTETYAFLFFFAALWAGLRLVRTGDTRWALAAGLAVGLAALSRPSYLYPAYVAVPVLLLWQLWPGRSNPARALRLAAAFAGAAAIVLVPWMARNAVQLGSFELTGGYAAFILIQRIAYNLMSWPEWLVAWVYWLPDFGDNLAASLFDAAHWRRLGWDDPQGFYQLGQVMRLEMVQSIPDADAQMAMVVGDRLLPNLGWHIAVTLPVTMRGMWAGGILGLVAVLAALPALPYFVREGRLLPLAVLALPILFMLGLHGFATVNVTRYNEPLLALYAVLVVGFVLASLDFWRRRGVTLAARLYGFAHGRALGQDGASDMARRGGK